MAITRISGIKTGPQASPRPIPSALQRSMNSVSPITTTSKPVKARTSTLNRGLWSRRSRRRIRAAPTVTMTGYSGLSDWGAGIDFPTYDVEISDNFTKVHGRHTFKAGILETGYKFRVPGSDGHLTIQLGSYNGGFGATGSWTGGKGWPGVNPSQGNAFADFLLGDLSSTNYATVVNSTLLSSRDWEWYAQDTWQATPRLTINYGVRYMYQSPWQERNRYYSPLDLSTSKLVLLQNGSTPVNPPTGFASVFSAYPFETAQQAGWSTD